MPLLPYSNDGIEIPVSDRVFNDTRIKQKARFLSLTHSQYPSRGGMVTQPTVNISVAVTMYAADGDGYGAELSGQGFAPYQVDLHADNDTLVDAATGEILEVRTSETAAEWLKAAESHETNVMFQADFFVMLRDNTPIVIGDLIKHHITAADAIGRFA